MFIPSTLNFVLRQINLDATNVWENLPFSLLIFSPAFWSPSNSSPTRRVICLSGVFRSCIFSDPVYSSSATERSERSATDADYSACSKVRFILSFSLWCRCRLTAGGQPHVHYCPLQSVEWLTLQVKHPFFDLCCRRSRTISCELHTLARISLRTDNQICDDFKDYKNALFNE